MGLWLVGSELTKSDLRAMVAHEVSLDSTSLIQVIHTFSPQKKEKKRRGNSYFWETGGISKSTVE